jgi:signal transduction histidine kinase
LDTASSTGRKSASDQRSTLLIVDDEDGPRQSLKAIFKDDYKVLVATSAEAALEIAQKNEIAVAVLDILMTGMSGIELLPKLKEIDPDTQVIMLTAYETLETARLAIRDGACDYMNKPFEVPAMRASVARALEKNRQSLNFKSSNERLLALQQEILDEKLNQEMLRSKGEIYASVLHDINGPLTVISGFIEMINRSIANSAHVDGEKLQSIKTDLGKLTGQVGRCFEISRRYLSFLNEGSTQSTVVGVNQILTDLRDLLIRHPAAQGHQLTIHPLDEDTCAEINGTDLLQILLNLTINALHCTEEPHNVDVHAERMAFPLGPGSLEDSDQSRFINSEGFANQLPMVALTVRDNGPGISAEIFKQMFVKKFTTKPADKGTGLGLSIVKRLTSQAKGGILLQTKMGRGTTFTVCLPTR